MATRKTLIFPVFLPQQGCPGRCVYCDQSKISGADPDLDRVLVQARQFIERHPCQPKQIAFYGGSFTALSQERRSSILQRFIPHCDEHISFRISTHPSFINEQILAWCGSNRIKTIELGIQDFDDEVLKQSCRSYTSETAIESSMLIREAGFELGLQLMPGLPGWTAGTLNHNHRILSQLKPRYLRLYPLIVIRGTELEKWYRQGIYTPLTLEEAIAQCADYCELCQRENIAVIKLGLPSNLDPADHIAGPYHPAFGELVKAELLLKEIEARPDRHNKLTLSTDQWKLLRAHEGFYRKILIKRIGNCTLEIVD